MIDFLAILLAKAFYGDEGAQGCLVLLIVAFFVLGGIGALIGAIFN